MSDIINDTEEVELELVEDPTTEQEPSETVDDQESSFDEALDSAESDEDFAKLGESLREEQPEEIVEDKQEEEVDNDPSVNFIIKDGDIELNITDRSKAIMLMQQGLNYAGKTTELAKYRSFVKYAEDKGISLEDMQMLNDIKAGNKDAYSALAKQSGIDVYDVSEETDYKVDAQQLNVQQEADPMVEAIAQEILTNEDYTKQFQKWLPHMPEDVQHEVTTNAQYLKGVQADMKAGLFDKSMNQAYSYMKIDGMNFGDAYVKAKQGFLAVAPQREQQPQVTRGDRQRASAGRKSSSKSKGSYGAGVISDLSNDEFLENFQDIISSLERPN